MSRKTAKIKRGAAVLAAAVAVASVSSLTLATSASAVDGDVVTVKMADEKGAAVAAKSGLTGGGFVTITGTGFPVDSKVWFGAVAATKVFRLDSTTILAGVPAAANSSATVATPVNVTVNDGNAAGTGDAGTDDDHTYMPPPTVTGGAYSTANAKNLEVTGTNLDSVTSIRFGSTSVAVKPAQRTAEKITITAPTSLVNANYTITVVSPYGEANLSSSWNVRPVAKKIISATSTAAIAGGSSTGGDLIRIVGTNLAGVTHVTFGTGGTSVTATSTSVLVASNTEILVRVPSYSGAFDSSGLKAKVDVIVKNDNLESSNKPKYEYRLLPSYTSKTLDSVSVASATATAVTIIGTNLKGGAVTFKTGTTVRNSVQTSADKLSMTELKFKIPATLPVGTHEVWIRTATGTVRAGDLTITS